jgi:hypothetical protein
MLKSAIALNVFQPQKVTDPYIYYSLSFLSLFFRSTLILLFFFTGVPVSTQWEASGYYYPGKIFFSEILRNSKN